MAHFPKPFFRPKKNRWYVQLDGKQIKEIIDTGRMPTPPPTSKPPRAEPPPLTRAQGTTIAPDYPPGLTEAPA